MYMSSQERKPRGNLARQFISIICIQLIHISILIIKCSVHSIFEYRCIYSIPKEKAAMLHCMELQPTSQLKLNKPCLPGIQLHKQTRSESSHVQCIYMNVYQENQYILCFQNYSTDDDAIWLQYLMFIRKEIRWPYNCISSSRGWWCTKYMLKLKWMNVHLNVPCKNALVKGDKTVFPLIKYN